MNEQNEQQGLSYSIPECLKSVDPTLLEGHLRTIDQCVTRQIVLLGEINRLGVEHADYPRLTMEMQDRGIQIAKTLALYTKEQRDEITKALIKRRIMWDFMLDFK